MDSRYERLYNSMLESGDLKMVFPRSTGIWEKDSTRFIREQQELEKLARIKITDIEEE